MERARRTAEAGEDALARRPGRSAAALRARLDALQDSLRDLQQQQQSLQRARTVRVPRARGTDRQEARSLHAQLDEAKHLLTADRLAQIERAAAGPAEKHREQ